MMKAIQVHETAGRTKWCSPIRHALSRVRPRPWSGGRRRSQLHRRLLPHRALPGAAAVVPGMEARALSRPPALASPSSHRRPRRLRHDPRLLRRVRRCPGPQPGAGASHGDSGNRRGVHAPGDHGPLPDPLHVSSEARRHRAGTRRRGRSGPADRADGKERRRASDRHRIDPAKAELARQAGADEVILYTEQDFGAEVKRLTAGRGVDVVYDSVGATTFMKA